MNIKRILRHLVMTQWQVKRAFPRQTLIAIEQAIKAGETAHVGEIRFVVEGALDGTPLFKGQSAREPCYRRVFAVADMGHRTQ